MNDKRPLSKYQRKQMTDEMIKYRIWHQSSLADYTKNVSGPEQALRHIRRLVNQDLAASLVKWNAFGLQIFDPEEDDEWFEWYDNDNNDIMDLFHKEYNGDLR